MLKKIQNNTQSGFSLIEISIAIVVIGFISVFIATGMNMQMEQAKKLAKDEREDIVRSSIAEYIKFDPANPTDVVNYPCPADPALPRGHEEFGKEKRNGSGNCFATGAIKEVAGTDGNPVFIGSIPTYTLGLSDVHAMDVHNKKYLYAVSGDVAETNALTAGNIVRGAITITEDVLVVDKDKDIDGLLKLDADGNPEVVTVETRAPFVVVSHGKNGRGAYNYNGVFIAGSCDGDALGDTENCNNDAVFALRTKIATDDANEFDDDVVFDIADKRVTIENCPAGSIMTGVSKGKPVCEELNLTCPPNQMMVGFKGATPMCQPVPVASAPPSLPRAGNPSTPRYVPPTSTRVSSNRPSNNTTRSSNNEGWLGAAYSETFGRAPDAAGADYWLAQEASGMPRSEIINHIKNSCEAKGTCNTAAGSKEEKGKASYATDFETKTGKSADSKATQSAAKTNASSPSGVYDTAAKKKSDSAVSSMESIYQKTLGRKPDADGAAYWKKQMDNGMSEKEVINHMSNSCEAKGTC